MNLREALITQSPSLALQRTASDEIAKLDAALKRATTTLMELTAPDLDAIQRHRKKALSMSYAPLRRYLILSEMEEIALGPNFLIFSDQHGYCLDNRFV